MTILLVLLAVLPSLGIIIFAYFKDKIRKSPLWMVILMILCGAVAAPLSYAIEYPGEHLLSKIVSGDGTVFALLLAFAVIAPVEEGLKFLGLWLGTRKNREYVSGYDAVEYAVFIGLSFAIVENIAYINHKNALVILIVRSFVSIFGHGAFAAVMGRFYANATFYRLNNRPGYVKDVLPALVLPMLLHGLFDFVIYTCPEDGFIAMMVYIIFATIFMVTFFLILNAAARDDSVFIIENSVDTAEINDADL